MRLILVPLLVLLCGCVTESVVDDLPPSTSFSVSVPVRLNPYHPQRVDPLREEFRDRMIRTGPYWTQVFSNSADIEEVFTIRKAHMHDNGFSPRTLFTYSIEGDLYCAGKVYPIKAQGSRSTGSRVELAKSQAIERALVSLVDSIEKYLVRCERAGREIPPPEHQVVDVYDELLKLKELVDKNILTQEEFESEKKKLLEST